MQCPRRSLQSTELEGGLSFFVGFKLLNPTKRTTGDTSRYGVSVIQALPYLQSLGRKIVRLQAYAWLAFHFTNSSHSSSLTLRLLRRWA